MRFIFSQKLFLFASALLAAVPLLFSSEIGPVFQIAFSVLFVAGWFTGRPRASRPKYRRAVTGALLAVFGVQIARVLLGLPMAAGAMEFIVILLGVKLIHRASASDDRQIILLSFLHVIAASAATDALLFGVCLLGFTAFVSPTLAMIHLRREMESRFGPERKRPDAVRALERLFHSKRVITPEFLAGSMLLSLPVLLTVVVLFAVFPRVGFGFLGRVNSSAPSVGFGDSLSLHDDNIENLKDTVLMRLLPVSSLRETPPRLSLKIRAAVMEKFDGNTWTRSKSPKWTLVKLGDRGYELGPPVVPDRFVFDVLLEYMNPKLLLLPEGTGWAALDSVPDRQGKIGPRLLFINSAGETMYEDTAELGIRYRVGITGASPPGAAPSSDTNLLELYPHSERLGQTASALAGSGTNRQKAERLVRALKTGYRYSLSLADGDANSLERTSLDRFLYTRKTGTCEHFATALTLMLRAVGIPARLVTGFMGADWNPVGEFYAVRQRSAHAWTEAFIDGKWVTLDAVPSAPGPPDNSFRAFSMLVEALQMQWRKRVVGYDIGAQEKLLLGLMRRFKRTPQASEKKTALESFVRPVAIVVLMLLAGAIFFRLYRRKIFSLSKSVSAERGRLRKHKEATAVYLALEHRLRRLGYPRLSHQTPNEHLDAVARVALFSLDDAARIIGRYNEVRFGGGAFSPGERKKLLLRAARIGVEIKSNKS